MQPVVVALLFGVLTDYLVFFVSGFRFRLERGESPRDAATAVTGELLPVVSTAALMIAGATMTLALSGVTSSPPSALRWRSRCWSRRSSR